MAIAPFPALLGYRSNLPATRPQLRENSKTSIAPTPRSSGISIAPFRNASQLRATCKIAIDSHRAICDIGRRSPQRRRNFPKLLRYRSRRPGPAGIAIAPFRNAVATFATSKISIAQHPDLPGYRSRLFEPRSQLPDTSKMAIAPSPRLLG